MSENAKWQVAKEIARYNARNGAGELDCTPAFILAFLRTKRSIRTVLSVIKADIKRFGETDGIMDAVWALEGTRGCIE